MRAPPLPPPTYKMALESEIVFRNVLRAEIDVMECIIIHLERLYGYVIHINDNGLAPTVVQEQLMETMRQLTNCLKEVLEILNDQATSFVTPSVPNIGRGRPGTN